MRTIRDVSCAVIGGAGFLGSHCVDTLIEDRGCNVLVIDNLVAGRREFVHPRAVFEHHDITGSEVHLANLFEWHNVKFVLNYAARPYVPDSYARPLRTFDVNAMAACKVMNAAQDAGVEGVLQISSAELYGDAYPTQAGGGWQMIGEDAAVVPHSTYGAAKAAIDALVQVRWREAGTPCIALRQFNCAGERETHPYVIPEIISQLSGYRDSTYITGPPVVRLGNNSARDFLYAGDQARLAVELLEKGEFGETFNLGSESSIRIYDLAALIGRLMGFSEVRVEQDPARIRKWEIWSLCSDNSKIYSVIEGRPLVPLEEALRRTIAWFDGNGRRWPWER